MTEEKPCARCGRPFERKAKHKDWSAVRYCSSACSRARVGKRDRAIEAAIVELLDARGPGKTICPSEAARRVSPDGWRALMPSVRYAVNRMAARGEVVVTQRGTAVDAPSARGAIRVKKR